MLALLDTVAREGVLPRADQAHMLLELGPVVVGRAVALRLARLPAEATALLEAAAILGDGTSLGQVAALAGLDPAPAARAARVLLHSDLLIRDDPVEFFHPVVRTAIYDGLDTLARSEGHRRAATVLTDAGALPEQAGAHLLATVAGRDPFVVTTLREAARRSLGQGAAEAAVAYLKRTLEEVDDDATRAEVLVELGLAERLIDGTHSAEHLAAGARADHRPAPPCRRGARAGSVLFYINRVADTMAVLERELAQDCHAEHPDLHERLEAEFIASTWWVPETFPLAAARLEALDLDNLHGGIGSDLLLADATFYECRLATDRAKAISLARRSLVSGELAESGALGFQFAGFSLVSTGLFDEAIAAYDAAHALPPSGAATCCAPRRSRCSAAARSCCAATSTSRSPSCATRSSGSRRCRSRAAFPYAVSFLAEALLERGEPGRGRGRLARGRSSRRAARERASLLLPVRPRPHRHRVRRGAARRRRPDGARRARRGWSCRSTTRSTTRGGASSQRASTSSAATTRRARSPTRTSSWPGAGARRHRSGAALRTSGVLRRRARRARRCCARRSRCSRGANARLEHARALVELGAALRRGNHRSEARDLLREGVELAHRAGAPSLVERGNEELAATGARPRKLVVSGLESLTASERRVAELAAQDHSATRRSPRRSSSRSKTVEVHLSSVYRKLQITSRRQLAPALAAAGPTRGSPPRTPGCG